jgi:hypothetical protein
LAEDSGDAMSHVPRPTQAEGVSLDKITTFSAEYSNL